MDIMSNHIIEEKDQDNTRAQEYPPPLSTSAPSDPVVWMENHSKKLQKQPLQKSKSSENLPERMSKQRRPYGRKNRSPLYQKKHSLHAVHYRPYQEFERDVSDYGDGCDYPCDYSPVALPTHLPHPEQFSSQEIQLVIQDNHFLHNQLYTLHHRFQAEKTDLQRRLRHLTARVHYLEGLKKCNHHSPEENVKPYHTQQGKRYTRYNHQRKVNNHNNENNDELCTTSEDHYPVDESADQISHDKKHLKETRPPSPTYPYPPYPHYGRRPSSMDRQSDELFENQSDNEQEEEQHQKRDRRNYRQKQYEIEDDYMNEPYSLRHHAGHNRLSQNFYPSMPVIYGPPPPPPPPHMPYPPFMRYGPPRVVKESVPRQAIGQPRRYSYLEYPSNTEADMKPFPDDEEDMQLLFDQMSMVNLPPPSLIMPPPPFAPISLSDEALPMPYLPPFPPPPPLPGHLVSQARDLAGPVHRASSRRSTSGSAGSNSNKRNSYI